MLRFEDQEPIPSPAPRGIDYELEKIRTTDPLIYIRARAVFDYLLECISEQTPTITGLAAKTTLNRIMTARDPSIVAAGLAPLYPHRTVSCYRSELVERKLETTQLKQGHQFLSTLISALPQHELPSVPSDKRTLMQPPPTDNSEPLPIALVRILENGISVGLQIVDHLARPSFIGSEIEIASELKKIHGQSYQLRILEIFYKAQERLLQQPPFSNQEVTRWLTSAILFARADGAIEQTKAFSEINKHLALSPDLLRCYPLLESICLEARATGSAARFASRLSRLCFDFALNEDLRGVEIPDLIFAAALYAEIMIGGSLFKSGRLSNELMPHLGYYWKEFELAHIASYANKNDAKLLRSAETHLIDLKIKQLLGEIETREQAITLLAGSKLPNKQIQMMLKSTGSSLGDFNPVRKIETFMGHNAEFIFIEGDNRTQFRPDVSLDEICTELTGSLDYPALHRSLKNANLSPSWEVRRLLSGMVLNLVDDEWLARDTEWMMRNCEGFKIDLNRIKSTSGSQRSYVHVNRARLPLKHIVLSLGFHADGFGMGLLHIKERHLRDTKLRKLLASAGERESDVRDYVLDGMLPVLGMCNEILPSGTWPKTHSILIDAPPIAPDTYIAVVVSKLPGYREPPRDAATVITSYVLGNSAHLKGFLLKELGKLMQRGIDQLLEEATEIANRILKKADEEPIKRQDIICHLQYETELQQQDARLVPLVRKAGLFADERSFTSTTKRDSLPPHRLSRDTVLNPIHPWEQISENIRFYPTIATEQIWRGYLCN